MFLQLYRLRLSSAKTMFTSYIDERGHDDSVNRCSCGSFVGWAVPRIVRRRMVNLALRFFTLRNKPTVRSDSGPDKFKRSDAAQCSIIKMQDRTTSSQHFVVSHILSPYASTSTKDNMRSSLTLPPLIEALRILVHWLQ